MPAFTKRIGAPVGRLGANLAADVVTIKYLLNTVPEANGGPAGVVLERTPLSELIQHIEHFQRRNLGFADGRVDVNGRTFQALSAFDPTPGDPPFVPNTISGKKRPLVKKAT